MFFLVEESNEGIRGFDGPNRAKGELKETSQTVRIWRVPDASLLITPPVRINYHRSTVSKLEGGLRCGVNGRLTARLGLEELRANSVRLKSILFDTLDR